MARLSNRTAIVTGASSGIGAAAARLFAVEGANVVVSGRNQAGLDNIVSAIQRAGGNAVAVAGDVRDEACARKLVDTATSTFGGLDIAFNNAGDSGAMGETVGIGLEAWNDTLATNLTSAFLGATYQLPALQERGGSLIFTSSFVGNTVALPGMAAYAAAKAGVLGLMRTLAVEYAGRGIRVNALMPGGTATRGFAETSPGEEQQAFARGLHALRRIGKPEELAQAALFLASDESSFMTGAVLRVDGGLSITRT